MIWKCISHYLVDAELFFGGFFSPLICTSIIHMFASAHAHTQYIPGYVSTGQLAYKTPVFLSSSFKFTLTPLATSFMRPVHSGSLKFQFAALEIKKWKENTRTSSRQRQWAQIHTQTHDI